jgi:anti-sigma regulatory factor (Ser/Thr protein kinase)
VQVDQPSAVRLDVALEDGAVRTARQFVAKTLDHWGLTEVSETAALLTSELATNVVLHARTGFAVVVRRTRVGAEIDVLDEGTGTPRRVVPHELGGRGLMLVEGLADAWGPTPVEDLKGFVKGVRFAISSAAGESGTSSASWAAS